MVHRFGLALELQRNRGEFKQGITDASAHFLFERRGVKSAHLNEFDERQFEGVAHPILRHGANYPQPDFEIRVHIKTRTGDLNVSVSFALAMASCTSVPQSSAFFSSLALPC